MARKRKIPPEFTKFKEDVEKLGFDVLLQYMPVTSAWSASVLKQKICIWHNNSLSKQIPLTKFWESNAHKNYVNIAGFV